MRIMGLDFGSKTVGVAVSDSLLLTAQGLEIIRRKEENKLRQTLARIEELIVEYQVEEIVLGMPKNMNGTEGVRVELTQEFREKLMRRTGLGREAHHSGSAERHEGGGHPQGKTEGICGQDSSGPDTAGLSGQTPHGSSRGRQQK